MSEYEGVLEQGVPLHKLNLMPDNHRVHDEEQIELLRSRLQKVGQTRPLVVSKRALFNVENPILDGNGVFEAMTAEGWSSADVLWYDMPEEEAIAESIADNRTSQKAQNDEEALLRMLTHLKENEYDTALAGYKDEEIKQLEDDIASREEEMSGLGFGDSGEGDGGDEFDTENQDESKIGVRVGEYKVIIERDDYFKWRDDIRLEVGFNKTDVCAEMLRRLIINGEASPSDGD